MRKQALIVLLLFGFATGVVAQQRPHYTQYILNNYILNPALSGIENYMDIKLSGREQWSGLPGAPKTFYLTAHAPIGKKDYKTNASSFDIPGGNPRGNSYWESYTASEPHHGVGFVALNDKTGNYNRFSADLSYAYHLGISPTTNIALGFSAGISQIGYDRSKATPGVPGDPAIDNGNNMLYKIRPDLNVGLWMYGRDFFFGISGQQIIPQKVSFTDDQLGIKLVPHIFATAGYRFLMGEDLNAIPSVMLKYVQGTPTTPQVEANMKVQYRDLLWAGGSYRYQNGFAAMVGFNVGNSFNVGYAYDFTTTVLNTASHGSHELILGFILGNKYGDTCPRNVW